MTRGRPIGSLMMEIYFRPEEPRINLNNWEAKTLLVEGKQFFQIVQEVMSKTKKLDELDKYLEFHPELLKILEKWTEDPNIKEIEENGK